MKQQYFLCYNGNKKDEVEQIYETLDFSGIDTVIEPFAGTSAMSYYIWKKHPTMKFIMNDNNPFFKGIFESIRSGAYIELHAEIMALYHRVKDDKEAYILAVKDEGLPQMILRHKYYNMHPGLFPNGTRGESTKRMMEKWRFEDAPIFEFFRNADITFLCEDWQDVYKANQNKQTLFLLDPPYMMSNNEYYLNRTLNVYEYFYYNKPEISRVYFIIEKTWITNILFIEWNVKEYAVTYKQTHKKTKHAIYTNAPIPG